MFRAGTSPGPVSSRSRLSWTNWTGWGTKDSLAWNTGRRARPRRAFLGSKPGANRPSEAFPSPLRGEGHGEGRDRKPGAYDFRMTRPQAPTIGTRRWKD